MCMANYKSGSRLSTSADSNLAEPRSASIHAVASSNTSSFPSKQMPATVRIETSEPFADIDGLPLLVPILVKDLLSTRDDSIPKNADAQTLLSIVLERMAARMRGVLAPMGDLSKQPITMVEFIWGNQSLVWSRVQPKRVLRVGSLELDLMGRIA